MAIGFPTLYTDAVNHEAHTRAMQQAQQNAYTNAQNAQLAGLQQQMERINQINRRTIEKLAQPAVEVKSYRPIFNEAPTPVREVEKEYPTRNSFRYELRNIIDSIIKLPIRIIDRFTTMHST